MPDPIFISARAGFHRRGRTGALNDLLRAASELLIPAVHAGSVDFGIATDRMGTYSYTSGAAKLDTYETTIVQEWARYMASHAAFEDHGVAWEAKFRTGGKGRPPAVDIVIENEKSTASRRVALFEVKVSEGSLAPDDLWNDAKKIWELTVKDEAAEVVPVQSAGFVVNIVSGLLASSTPESFSASAKALADRSRAEWHPRLDLVFSAVFPVFRPSKAISDKPMWILHGIAGFEVKGSTASWMEPDEVTA